MTRSADQVRTTLSPASRGNMRTARSAIDGDDRLADDGVEAAILLAVADHDAALVGLAHRDHRVVQEGRGLLGDDDLALARPHRRVEPDHRREPRIAEARREHDLAGARSRPRSR